MLDSRNPYEKGFKAPIRLNSIKYFDEVFEDTIKYLSSLKIDGIPLLGHKRKTFVLGFIVTMKSTINLAKDLFSSDNPLKYFLNYKFSQDHLELYFSWIRSRGGWNNNPNSQQLKWALRQLLFRNSIKASLSANCCEFGEYCTPAFEFRSNEKSKTEKHDNIDNQENIKDITKYLEERNLSKFQTNILYYITGYIIRNLIETSTCNDCVAIFLYRDQKNDTDPLLKIIKNLQIL